jgi:hypothetical protein
VSQAVAGVQEALRDPGLTAARSHKLWAERMRAEGWTYGEVKDPERRTHPALVPFGELPVGQQAKDRLFIAIVRALAPKPDSAVGYRRLRNPGGDPR